MQSVCVYLLVLSVGTLGFSSSGSRPSTSTGYLASLQGGQWVKFISGASNQDLPLIRNLCLLYTLAGVDCIDLSADPAVVTAAELGVERALEIMNGKGGKPLLMVSVNDDEDPHFRKAWFDPEKCPKDCPRPCERACPANAIYLSPKTSSKSPTQAQGVVNDRCYGCGRCIPVCPLGIIQGNSYRVNPAIICDLFSSGRVDAIEIHTQPFKSASFAKLWQDIGESILRSAKVVAVSFPDMGDSTLSHIETLQNAIHSNQGWPTFNGVQIWQTDGRPMSGDIGKGTAHSSVAFGHKVLRDIATSSVIDISQGRHFVQLAGGTNDYSVTLAKTQGLSSMFGFGGFAYGGFARKSIGDILRRLEDVRPGTRIEDHSIEFELCQEFAIRLVSSVKSSSFV